MVTRLWVTYKNPEVDKGLDEKILEFFNTLDFVCIDRAYHPMIFRRDIFFEKQSEIDAGKKIAKTMLDHAMKSKEVCEEGVSK